MRILHVTRQFLPATGGIERAVYKLAQEQRALGHQVGVLTLNRLFEASDQIDDAPTLACLEEIDGLDVRRIPYTGSSRYAIAPAALDHVHGFDLVHVHSTDFFLNYLASTKRLHGKPLVLTSHGLFFHTTFAQRLKQAYFHSVMRWNLRAVDAVICVSQPDYDMLIQIAPRKKLHLLPNGVSWQELSSLRLTGRDPDLMLAVGSLAPRKGYERMLHAFAVANVQHPATRLVIVGADHGEGARLMELAHHLGIAEQTSFVGRVDEVTLRAYLERATLFLSSSNYEGFGIAALEAAVAGALPIMHPLPVYRSIFSSPECAALFVNYDDAERAGAVMLGHLQQPDDVRLKLARTLRDLSQGYSWPSIARTTQALYEAVFDPPELLANSEQSDTKG